LDPCLFVLNCAPHEFHDWLQSHIRSNPPEPTPYLYGGMPVHLDYEAPWQERRPGPAGGYELYLDSWLRLANEYGLENHPRCIEATILPIADGKASIEIACTYGLAGPFFLDLLIAVSRTYSECTLTIATYLKLGGAPLPSDLRMILESNTDSSHITASDDPFDRADDSRGAQGAPGYKLGERDSAITRLWAQRLTAGQIAERLGLDEKTVRNRVSTLRSVLGPAAVPYHDQARR